MDKNEMKESLESFLENPYWAEYYNSAPSDMCKKYIQLEFYYSDTEDEDAIEPMEEIEGDLDLRDWQHLLKYCENSPRKLVIQQKIKELS